MGGRNNEQTTETPKGSKSRKSYQRANNKEKKKRSQIIQLVIEKA